MSACVPAVLALSLPSQAFAQTASAEDIAAARSLGTEGTRLADSGDCNGAIVKLQAAEKLYHAPTTLDRLGECQISVGRLVEGTESLNRLVRETLPASAPPVFVAAQKRAQHALAVALPRIGNLKVHVDGAPPDKISLTVDGTPMSVALLDADRPTDPGSHEISASAAGYRTATSTVTVREGAEATVSLKLEIDPTAAVAVTATPSTVPAPVLASTGPTPTPPEKGPDHTPAIAAFVVGGVGLAVGTVFGILALGTKSTLNSHCVDKVCPSSEQSDIDSLSTKSTVSTIGFGVGIVGVAAGAILLAVSHHSESGATAAEPSVSPWIGLGSAGLRGAF